MEETKIFVVITVLSTVLIGLAVYLFWLDRRVTKMEKEINNSKKQS
ncbi:MAG TPA: CcmD family protein [Bacteroidales bacterium]|jgi:CcmD family protein|nr:CcmD family protein [Bacteroidales bacterium]